jgi:hypothetical protein
VWALGNVASQQVFNGKLRIVFSTNTQNVTIAGSPPWDGAPGGSRASFTELDTTAAPYGDIVALYPSHCFIPTISALALATTDPFFNVAGAADPLALSPFDAIYYPTDNQEHVLITPENAVWVKTEIEQGVVGVGGNGPGARGLATLTCAPSPFVGAARLSFTLSRTGPADLRIYALDGREVRVLVHESAAPGTHVTVWDGRDAHGARVPAGVYFARLLTPDARKTLKVVKLG